MKSKRFYRILVLGAGCILFGHVQAARALQTISFGSPKQIPPTMIGANVVMDRDQFQNDSVDPWSDPQHLADLVETGMSVIRYPGGTHGNYFDWLGGYKYDQPTNYSYPPEDTKRATDALDGKVMWMLNVITESLQDVTNALGTARDQGVEVKYVELGNEFYFNAYDPTSVDYDSIYYFEGVSNGWATGTDYGTDMNTWVSALKTEFPDVLISLPMQRGIVTSTTSRRAVWNAQVDAACTNYDAATVHVYTDSLIDLGYGDTKDSAEQTAQWNYFTSDTNAVQLVMGSAQQGWADMINHENFWLPEDKPVWFTEFGVKPETMPCVVKGTWADGLANFILYHALLSFPQGVIAAEHQYIDLHHGGSDEFSDVKISVGQNLSGTLGALTAEGHVIRALSNVARDKELLSVLSFGNVHMVSPPGIGPYPALIGLRFSDAVDSNIIIANISDQLQEIDTTGLGPAGADVTLMTADHFYTFIVADSDMTYSTFTMGATLELPPFSICTITGVQSTPSVGSDEFTPKFSGTRIPAYASDDMAHNRPVSRDVTDQNSGEILSYSLTGNNPAWVEAAGTAGLNLSPAPIGSFEVYVRVEDASGLTDYATFDVAVIDGTANFDSDDLSNNDEILLGTDPYLTDTDDDGYSDSEDAYPLDSLKHADDGPATTNLWQVVHGWYYDGLTNGAGLSSALSTGSVGGIAFPDDGLPTISNNAVRWEYDGIDSATFSTLAPAGYTGVVSGVYQLEWTYISADFSNTDAADGGANVGFGIRSTANGNEDARFRLRYDGVGNQFLLQVTDADASDVTVAVFPGYSLLNLKVRMVLDLDHRGAAGSLKFYYTPDGGAEVAGSLSMRLPSTFRLDVLRHAVQSTNGTGNDWQAGDVVITDNLLFSRQVQVVLHEFLYDQWVSGYPGLGSATNLTDNPDHDLADNLAEYAYGGNPDDGQDAGHWPQADMRNIDGTNYLELVHVERTDAMARGLAYVVQTCTNLEVAGWSDIGLVPAGEGPIDPDFIGVTNRVFLDEDQRFIRWRIEYAP